MIRDYTATLETDDYTATLETAVEITIAEGDHYQGDYTVTPSTETAQILETAGLHMDDDVTVLEIPYFETTNESGGYTVVIG